MLTLIKTDTQDADTRPEAAPAIEAETARIEDVEPYDWSNVVFSGAYCKEAERRLVG